jgi:DNA-binding YbaB/EbfC family protein
MNNMQQLMAQAKKLQKKIEDAKSALGTKEVTGSAGAGSVTVVMTLNGNMRSISIKEEVIDPKERDMLEALIMAAMNDAKEKADKMYDEGITEATGGLVSNHLL